MNDMLVEQLGPEAGRHLVTITTDALVREAAILLAQPEVNLVVVCRHDGTMAGVVTKTDVVNQIGQCTGCSCTMRVDEIMTRAVTSARPHQWLNETWTVMKERGLQNVPILDEISRPIGVIYARDALQALLGEVENEEALLRDYVTCVGYH